MKKLTIIGLVIVLLAFSAIPVLAAGPNHGHGNGAGAGQSSNGGDQNQNRNQDRNKGQGNRVNVNGARGKNNATSMRMRTPFYLQGTITAIDTAGMTITVQVVHGNAQVKQFVGAADMPITIKIGSSTRIVKITQGVENGETEEITPSTGSTDDESPANRVVFPPGDMSAFTVGDYVAVHGNVVSVTKDNVVTKEFDATMVTIYVREVTNQPEAQEP